MKSTIIFIFNKIKIFKEFCVKYPAVLSGTFIYGYLAFCIIQYLFKTQNINSVSVESIVESFDAVPFMWLLSVSLVKIIDARSKLHKIEEEKIILNREKELQETKLKTFREVTRGVQHHINNPLAILTFTISNIRKEISNNVKVEKQLEIMHESIERIKISLDDFSKVEEYAVDSAGENVGNIAIPVH